MELAKFTPTADTNQHPLKRQLTDAIVTFERNRPRSLQKALGPSGYGDPCCRRIAYQLLDEPTVNAAGDPWPSIIGTAGHAYIADSLLEANQRAGELVWLVEQRVKIRAGLEGSCDAYHVPTATVVDHKIVGTEKHREYRLSGPSAQYEKQVHIYGYGFEVLGLPVNEVAIAFYPRAGVLSGLHVWSAKYDRQIAVDAIDRVDNILDAAVQLDVEHHPENYTAIPRTPSRNCLYCAWMCPGEDTGRSCPGNTTIPTAPTAVA
jgi:hypothetical protein